MAVDADIGSNGTERGREEFIRILQGRESSNLLGSNQDRISVFTVEFDPPRLHHSLSLSLRTSNGHDRMQIVNSGPSPVSTTNMNCNSVGSQSHESYLVRIVSLAKRQDVRNERTALDPSPFGPAFGGYVRSADFLS